MPIEGFRFVGIPAGGVPLALGKQLSSAMTQIGRRVYDRALITVPRGTGRLAASHYVLAGSDSSGNITVQVGANATQPGYEYNGSYAASVHNGSRPHDIYPVRASILRFVKNGQTVFTPVVHHPGTHAQPWLWTATIGVIRSLSSSSERLVPAGVS